MQAAYRLVTYTDQRHEQRAGVVASDRLIDAEEIPGVDRRSVLEILRHWDAVAPRLQEVARRPPSESSVALSDVQLLAPILHPGAFFCAGANYWDHLAEMADVAKRVTGVAPSMNKAAEPWFFMKTTVGTIVGDGAPVRLPNFSKKVDWEAELGVVIGRAARNVCERDALTHVAGYLIVNDLSARDHIKREGSPFVYDWIGQKCFDDAAPMGPWLTPASHVPNPHNLAIKLWVNGVLKQSSSTSQMVHGIAEQIAYLSRHVTLQPGDVIATGTPAGVGLPRDEFLQIGDEVRIEIEGVGSLTNKMIADDSVAFPKERIDGH